MRTRQWKIKGSFPIDANTRDAIRNKTKTSEHGREHTLVMMDAARQKYKKARNKAKPFLRKVKRLFEKGIALQSKRNPKAFWANTRRKLKTKCGVSPLLVTRKRKHLTKTKAYIRRSQKTTNQRSQSVRIVLYQTYMSLLK